MNMNRLISMLVRQLMNVGIRKGIQMAANRSRKPGGATPANPDAQASAQRSAKVTRRVNR
ncbi:MAG: hypothetical protein II336_18835 [Loktanella sp.]|nr:hypothetical protein [Loktanella sp.]